MNDAQGQFWFIVLMAVMLAAVFPEYVAMLVTTLMGIFR